MALLHRQSNIFNANVNINDVADTYVSNIDNSTSTTTNTTIVNGPPIVTALPSDNTNSNLVILHVAGVGDTYYAWMAGADGIYGWREVIAVV